MNPKEKFTVTDDKTGKKYLVEVIKEVVEKKKITYEDVLKEVMASSDSHCIRYTGDITKEDRNTHTGFCATSLPTKQLAKKVQAIITLINTAWYLNKGEELPWDIKYFKNSHYAFTFDNELRTIRVESWNYLKHGSVYFNTKELAEQAFEILGEDVIKTAIL
ncbi:hypothetical protein M0P65_06710 [Candidatus Gracilibacteria bacterium]|jgi:hypothetical protein|nr:hypothetical protein [Candidatus Gracilibacteria bacterium]